MSGADQAMWGKCGKMSPTSGEVGLSGQGREVSAATVTDSL